jgi:hypothetical protein
VVAWKPDYVSASELREYISRSTETIDDTFLGFDATAASRAVDSHTHRQFGNTDAAQARVYEAHWNRRRGRWVAIIDDVMVNPSTVLNDDDDALTDFTLLPRNAQHKGKPWEALMINPSSAVQPTGAERLLTITADPWGWTAVPTSVKEATLIQGNRLHARRFSPYGIAGSPDQGSELRLLARVDPDVAVTLRGLVRWWAAA